MAPSVTQNKPAEDAWEEAMARGQQNAREAQWEMALQAYTTALSLCAESKTLQSDQSRRDRVLKELALVNRCMGRYEHALELLHDLLAQPSLADDLRVKTVGEIGHLYRQLNRLEEARDAFQEQYTLASQSNDPQRICRAVGNLGMANYQLSEQGHNAELLDLAAQKLRERVRLARKLKEAHVTDPTKASKSDYLTILEAIGLSRLSLCYSSRGQHEEAIASALSAVELETKEKPFSDPSVEAIGRFFYGRALDRAGQHEAALEQFDLPKECSPAVAFAKEPSDEHCQYLRELLNAGAEMDRTDVHHYNALDYAVFNGNKTAETIILKSLEKKLSKHVAPDEVPLQLAKRFEEAKLRRHYREIFQEQMRPILLSRKDDSLHRIRQAHASAIRNNVDFGKAFDQLKFVRYTDFTAFRRFPRSSDGLTQVFDPAVEGAAAQHIIFISYRWIKTGPWATYPDNSEHKQYRRIVRAVEEYRKQHPSVDIANLGIWIDFACIDQDDAMPGISALPLIIAQCDALISLVDEQYHDRAWCSVEVMMIKALREEYKLHLWYEHVEDSSGEGILRVGPEDLDADPRDKKLSLEADRKHVLFLERQCRLLC